MPLRNSAHRFVRGQKVEVRSADEILATLDSSGKLDGVPFMPEMVRFCGRQFTVHRRADKTCVEGYGVRRMQGTVFLEGVRCNGASHDGCQRHCLIFWKEAWLRPIDDDRPARKTNGPIESSIDSRSCELATREGDRYFCQSTELSRATTELSIWNLTHFLSDLLHRELSLAFLFRIIGRMAFNRGRRLFGLKKIGTLTGNKTKTFRGDLDLKPGEWVEVKTAEEIEQTVDPSGRNGGLTFEPDMLEFCGRKSQVAFPIQRIISEETGQMIELSRTVALQGVACTGLCAKNCPRNNPFYWREAWLRRIESPEKAPLLTEIST